MGDYVFVISVLGTGHYLPKNILTNDDLSKLVDTNDEWIFSRTGIKERHIAKDETALSIALNAANAALQSAQVRAQDLGLIIVSSITADMLVPSFSCQLAGELGASCSAVDINAACSGFVYAMKIGAKLYEDKPVLIVGCELLSRITDWTDRSTCVLFGDGAGAAVLGERDGEGILAIELMAYPDKDLFLALSGVNQSERAVLSMDGKEIYKFATRTMPESITRVLGSVGLTVNDVDLFIPHQANARIILAASERLGVPVEKFYMNIEHTGNTSCASCGIALSEAALSGALRRGQLVVISAFGGGLTTGTAVFRF